MNARPSALAWLLVVSSLSGAALGACKDDGPRSGGPEMAIDTTPPVTAYEDRERGVWLMPPDEDFEVLTGEAATALHPEATVGLTNHLKCKGFVTVAPAAGKNAEQWAEAVRAGFDLTDAKVVQDEAVLYCGETGWRVEAWGKNAAGQPAARRATFLVASGKVYGVYAHGDNTIHTRMRRCLDSVTAAFDLLDTE